MKIVLGQNLGCKYKPLIKKSRRKKELTQSELDAIIGFLVDGLTQKDGQSLLPHEHITAAAKIFVCHNTLLHNTGSI